MRKFSSLLLLVLTVVLVGCNKGNQINGHTMKTAFRSVKGLKEKLPPEQKIEFEVSFWTIRDSAENDKNFLSLVDGLTPMEVISKGKEIYQQRKAQGFQKYEKYQSWEDMITQFSQERMNQDRKIKNNKDSARDKANNVLYKL